jgi:hypothetical protein
MARQSLRPHLNQIRTWVRQGRTDAWIAHQLDVTGQQIEAFKREQGLAPGEEGEAAPAVGVDFDDEIDLRAEDDALIAAELEAAEAAASESGEPEEAAGEAESEDDGEGGERPRPRRRRRRRSSGRPRSKALEGTFDHGEEGYGLWLDPAIADDGVYAEHWAGHRPVIVTVEQQQIVIRRAGEEAEDDE